MVVRVRVVNNIGARMMGNGTVMVAVTVTVTIPLQ